jgi:hypothetical protein
MAGGPLGHGSVATREPQVGDLHAQCTRFAGSGDRIRCSDIQIEEGSSIRPAGQEGASH